MIKNIFHKILRAVKYSKLAILHTLSKQVLPRIPEPDEITSDLQDVHDYSKVMSTMMALPYLLSCDIIQKARRARTGAALDLCCGPGLFTTLVGQEMGYTSVTGVDLSREMLTVAQNNVSSRNLDDRVNFMQDDVSKLNALKPKSYDLVTFLNGAHHFPSVDKIRQTLKAAEQVTSDQGLIVVMDPIRQKTTHLAEGYIKTTGQDYLDQNLPNFYRQFRDSLYASWSAQELWSAIPENSPRTWVQLTPAGIPTFQIIVGLPVGQSTLNINEGLPDSFFKRLVPSHLWMDWRFFRAAFAVGNQKIRRPIQHPEGPKPEL